MKLSRVALFGGALLTLSAPASFADNLTIGTAANYVIGQGWVTTTAVMSVPAGTDGRYYKFGVVPQRSYCAETATADFGNDDTDTGLGLYNSAQSLIGFSDDAGTEPSDAGDGGASGHGASRICWIANLGETKEYLRLFDYVSAVDRRFRIADTSLWAPWFFSGSGFEAFILIKNTTNQPRTAVVTLYSTAGIPLGSASAVIPANGSLNYQVSGAPFALASATGTVQISHNAAPGGLVASVTSLSFGNGVSFDVAASPRQDFRQ